MKKSVLMTLASVAILGSTVASAEPPAAESAPTDIPGLQATQPDNMPRSSKSDDSVKFEFHPENAGIPATSEGNTPQNGAMPDNGSAVPPAGAMPDNGAAVPPAAPVIDGTAPAAPVDGGGLDAAPAPIQ